MSVLKMSGIHTNYEITKQIGNGGDTQYYEEKYTDIILSNTIAKEIVNEILENALEIATRSSESGIPWQYLGKNNTASLKQTLSSQLATVHYYQFNKAANIMNPTEKPIVSKSETNTLNLTNEMKTTENIIDCPLEIEVKKLISEILTPQFEAVNCNPKPPKCGVGDQPIGIDGFTIVEHVVGPTARIVEKKSRVTDLVKNSPQLITEYYLLDELSKQNRDEWEESQERLVQVIELSQTQQEEKPIRGCKMCKHYAPETIALPEDNEGDLITMPSDENMEPIDLTQGLVRKESFGKEHIFKKDNDFIVSMATEDCRPLGGIEYSESQQDEKHVVNDDTDSEDKSKKKWCFRLCRRIFKKTHKQIRDSPTSEKKI